jgi:adenylosuccinate synthase
MRRLAQVLAVVGGQYGSEGKGNIAHRLADSYDVHVRTGGPNAGHSFKHMGNTWKMQQVPCGWTNRSAKLFLGPGALIDLEILSRELREIQKADPSVMERVHIHPNASILEPRHHEQEGGTEGELHRRIGSTGEGCGAVRIARLQREPHTLCLAHDVRNRTVCGRLISDMLVKETWLPECIKNGASVLLEGTQGFGLSILHGPWPFVTTSDPTAAGLAMEAGIAPHLVRALLVVRTFPIRVAGNSGPLPHETSWHELSQRLGFDVEERTTVTNKVRRVASWDEEIVAQAVAVNRPIGLAINFCDYLDPAIVGAKRLQSVKDSPVWKFVQYLETVFNTPVFFIGTGGSYWSVIER